MSTAIITTQATGGYLDNVGRAALNFARALFALAPATAAASHGSVSQASALRDRAALLRLAKDFDATSPSQAAELRNLAGRD
ncbi:hypothetical protein IP92_05591 [Pseudoduganella flava]|uniref:Uncharacterized protein n=1 Tax=Pseudoduganella flava TaxID=871742 RepID=A0A562PCQ3_9BURK|nr:hypothetical protein [Pseudoduganella flava]QGZ40055.1 hypothetical protein GO485_13965 [Pseudoduganella flava]TWI42199.1 hypothetical protein IP92_05591 [Pseudoduganella flava]